MRSAYRVLIALVLCLATFSACKDDPAVIDDGVDAGGEVDAGRELDASRAVDARSDADVPVNGAKGLGPAGGTLDLGPGKPALNVPSGALAQDTRITIATAPAPDANVLGATPVGEAAELGPDGTTFVKPVEIRLSYDPARIPAGRTAKDIRVRMAPRGSTTFVTLQATLNEAARTVTTKTSHFTTFVPSILPASTTTDLFIVSDSTLPPASVAVAYTTTLQATGGTAPYTWSVASGTVPPGLTLSTTGSLAGTPTAVGIYSFFVAVQDSAATSVQAVLSLTVQSAVNPAPVLTSVTPATVGTGAAATITLAGSGFVPSSAARLDGTDLPTTFSSASSLSASVPAASTAAPGEHVVTVFSPTPGGGTSGERAFSVVAPNPSPVITSFDPTALNVSGVDRQVKIIGTGFLASTTVTIEQSPVTVQFINATSLDVTVPASMLGSARTLTVRISNPAPGGGQQAAGLNVVGSLVPVISGVTPSPIPVSASATQVTVQGQGFDATTIVRIDTTDIPTLYVAENQLKATVPASYVAAPGNLTFRVYTPPPGGGLSTTSKVVAVSAAGSCTGADLQTDPANCGVCGHSCLGGACSAGKCQPVVLATRSGTPVFMTTDASNVYWSINAGAAGGGEVAYCPKTGCPGGPTILASSEYSPSRLVTDATNLYWSNQAAATSPGGSVARCAIAGCGGAPTRLANNEWGARVIALAGDSLFWDRNLSPELRRCSLASGCESSKTTAAGSEAAVDMEADSEWLYWANANSGNVLKCRHTLSPLSGGCGAIATPTTVASVTGGLSNIALDANNVYWAGPSSVAQCSVNGCASPTTLFAGPTSGAIAVDATDVYFGSSTSIRKCAIGGCASSPTDVATGISNPTDMRVDAAAIYWVSPATQQIMKLAK